MAGEVGIYAGAIYRCHVSQGAGLGAREGGVHLGADTFPTEPLHTPV